MADAITIEIWNPTDTSQTEDFPIPEDTPDDLAEVTEIRFSIYSGLGMGRAGFTIHKDVESLDVGEGYIVRILDAADQQQYIGRIISATPLFEDNRVYSDQMVVVADNELVARVPKIAYTLQEDNEEGSDKEVSTTINAVYQDIMEGGQHAGKYTPNKMPLKDFSAITYSAGNNTLPSTSIGISHDEVNAYQALMEMLHAANGTLSSGERYVWYLDRTNALYTKQRSASILATFDIGTYSGTDYDNFISDSDDIEGRLRGLDGDLTGIHNMFIVNKTVIESAQHLTEEENSQEDHGISPLYINDLRVGLNNAGLTLFWDGINLGLFEPLVGYEFPLKGVTYGDDPFFPAAPDGYIRLTKDGGTLFGDFALREIHVSFSSGRYSQRLVIGGYRPAINTFRLYQDSQKPAQTTEPDTMAPIITALNNRPSAYEKTYTKTERDFYTACNAEDKNGIAASSVKAYLSKLTLPDTWGAYVLMGTLTFNAAPDSDSQAYYELSTGSGYYDLVATGGLSEPSASGPGSIFKVKIIAKDPAGNTGESVREFQLGEDAPDIVVSVVPPDVDDNAAPSVFEISSSDGFSLRIDTTTQAVDTIVVTYDGGTVNTTLTSDASGIYFLTDDMARPGKGKTAEVQIKVTNKNGKASTVFHYIKGVIRQSTVPAVIISDPSDVVDEETTTVQQYIDNIEFKTVFKEDGFIVEDTDVEFKVYGPPVGSLWPPYGTDMPVLLFTYTEATSPDGVFETATGSGIFKLVTDIATIGLDPGMYTVTTRVRKNEVFRDITATDHDRYSVWEESDHTQFQIITSGKTLGKDLGDTKIIVTDHDSRLPDAEKKNIDGSNKIEAVGNEWEITDSVINAGKLGKQLNEHSGYDMKLNPGTNIWEVIDSRGTSVVGAAGNPTGTTADTFTVDSDNSGSTSSIKIGNVGGATFVSEIRNNGGILQAKGKPADSWTNIAAAATDLIQATFGGFVYQLKVNSSDGSMTFTKDPGGTPVVLMTISATGVITTYNDITPDTDIDSTIGDTTHRYAAIHGEEVDCKDLIFTNNGTTEKGSFTYHAGSDRIVPTKILLGFWED